MNIQIYVRDSVCSLFCIILWGTSVASHMFHRTKFGNYYPWWPSMPLKALKSHKDNMNNILHACVSLQFRRELTKRDVLSCKCYRLTFLKIRYLPLNGVWMSCLNAKWVAYCYCALEEAQNLVFFHWWFPNSCSIMLVHFIYLFIFMLVHFNSEF